MNTEGPRGLRRTLHGEQPHSSDGSWYELDLSSSPPLEIVSAIADAKGIDVQGLQTLLQEHIDTGTLLRPVGRDHEAAIVARSERLPFAGLVGEPSNPQFTAAVAVGFADVDAGVEQLNERLDGLVVV